MSDAHAGLEAGDRPRPPRPARKRCTGDASAPRPAREPITSVLYAGRCTDGRHASIPALIRALAADRRSGRAGARGRPRTTRRSISPTRSAPGRRRGVGRRAARVRTRERVVPAGVVVEHLDGHALAAELRPLERQCLLGRKRNAWTTFVRAGGTDCERRGDDGEGAREQARHASSRKLGQCIRSAGRRGLPRPSAGSGSRQTSVSGPGLRA